MKDIPNLLFKILANGIGDYHNEILESVKELDDAGADNFLISADIKETQYKIVLGFEYIENDNGETK